MKRSDSPDTTAVDSLLLDAKGKEILLECYPDGEILFWSDDGIHLEFDRKHTALIIAALRKQDKLPKPARESQAAEPPAPQRRQAAVAAPAAAHPRRAASSEPLRQPNRRVAKEGPGWGATVVVEHKTHRYYYDKRDQAREAEGSHRIGEAGRIA